MATFEQLQATIVQLTGALNAHIEIINKMEKRLERLEAKPQHVFENTTSNGPKNEFDLKEISKLPDCVKELQIFDGNPLHYVSWVNSVEGILEDYEIVKDKPIYRAILQSIRQKIRGTADSALISYNIFNGNWSEIKNCLSLHYADKRDQRTLEHQLGKLTQGNRTIDEFYANVNHQLSLILNKIKTESYNKETMIVLTEMYRNRALDVFVRGLSGEVSRMLCIQRPTTLPEAYASCLEIQNLNFRNLPIHNRNINNTVTIPINQIPQRRYQQETPKPLPRLSLQQKNMGYGVFQQQQQQLQPQQQEVKMLPPRPIYPKPPTPMDIDESMRTVKIDYMNRPTYKREQNSDANIRTRKQQRVFHLEQSEPEEEKVESYEDYTQKYEDIEDSDDNDELNFIEEASLAYLT